MNGGKKMWKVKNNAEAAVENGRREKECLGNERKEKKRDNEGKKFRRTLQRKENRKVLKTAKN